MDFETDDNGSFWQMEPPWLLVLKCTPERVDEGERRHMWALFLEIETDDHEPDAIAFDRLSGEAWLRQRCTDLERGLDQTHSAPCLALGDQIVWANHVDVNTHEDLERVYADALPSLHAAGFEVAR